MNVYVDIWIYFVYTKNKTQKTQTSKRKTRQIKNQNKSKEMKVNANTMTREQPKEVLSQMNLKEDDTIGIQIYDGKMTIEKINKSLNLIERLEAFYKKPIDEIYVESTPEVDVGDPVGNEQW